MGHKNVYIFSISILQIKICLSWIDEKPFDYLLFNHERKKMWFLSEGLNDHKIIFTISFVWVDILLFSLMLDVVFFFQLVLVIREYTNNARKKSRFSQYYNLFTRMSFEESDHHVIFSKKIYLLKWKGQYCWSMKSFVFLAEKKCDVCRICKDDLVCLEFAT